MQGRARLTSGGDKATAGRDDRCQLSTDSLRVGRDPGVGHPDDLPTRCRQRRIPPDISFALCARSALGLLSKPLRNPKISSSLCAPASSWEHNSRSSRLPRNRGRFSTTARIASGEHLPSLTAAITTSRRCP